ncbi:hypothetical protein IAT38_001731 [Cryptococcus sp. DSM 104549]
MAMGYEADVESDGELVEPWGNAGMEVNDANASATEANKIPVARRCDHANAWLREEDARYSVELDALLPELLRPRVTIVVTDPKAARREGLWELRP